MDNKIFSKKEVSEVTGLSLRQLDYWGKDQLDIVPEYVGKKHSNVVYTLEQVLELLLASHLKEQGFSTDYIAGMIMGWRINQHPLDTYVIELPRFKTYKKCFENYDLDIIKRRLVYRLIEDDVAYVMISINEFEEFIEKLVDYKYAQFNVTRFDLREQFEKKALKLGVSLDKSVA